MSDLDDHLIGEPNVESAQAAESQPDRELLSNVLNPPGQISESESESDDESDNDDSSDEKSEADNINMDFADESAIKILENATEALKENFTDEESGNKSDLSVPSSKHDESAMVTALSGTALTSGISNSGESSNTEQETSPQPEEDIFSKLKQLHTILADEN